MLYLVIFLFVLIAIGMSKAEIIYEYSIKGGNDHVIITIYLLWKLIKFRKDISKDTDKKEKQKTDTELHDKYIHLKQLYHLFSIIKKYLNKKLEISDLKIKFEIGTGDACYTGIAAGMAWSLIGTAISTITSTFKTKKFNCKVLPDFNKRTVKLDLDCIFTIKIVHIIVVALKMLIYYLKNKHKFKKTVGGDLSG